MALHRHVGRAGPGRLQNALKGRPARSAPAKPRGIGRVVKSATSGSAGKGRGLGSVVKSAVARSRAAKPVARAAPKRVRPGQSRTRRPGSIFDS